MVDEIEAFHGSGNPLSNLHTCPNGCEIQEASTIFPSSEYHFQFKKLKHHNLGKQADLLLLESDTFKVIKKVKEILLETEVLDTWKDKAYEEMLETNHLKYTTCEHIREVLLDTAQTIVEATGDPYWGSRLNVQQTKECLVDYWPRENNMGKILISLRDEF